MSPYKQQTVMFPSSESNDGSQCNDIYADPVLMKLKQCYTSAASNLATWWEYMALVDGKIY